MAAPQLALILVNPRLSNLHPFVLRSGRQAARLSPRFTTGIFRVSSQGTGTDGGGREEGAKPENDDSSRSFHVNFTRDCRSFRCRLRPEKERERGEEEWRRIDQLDGKYLRNERCIGGLEIEIARQDVNDLGKKRKETRG